jgi:prophage antirepressor-like protein
MKPAIFIFAFNGGEYRIPVLNIGDEPWFVAKGVCQLLEIQNVSQAVARLDDDEKMREVVYTLGGPQRLLLVSESGLYALIMSSRTPAAKDFQHWVCAEVLPTIRKTGSYSIFQGTAQPQQPQSQAEAKLTRAQQLALWAQQLADAEQQQLQQQQRRINPGR